MWHSKCKASLEEGTFIICLKLSLIFKYSVSSSRKQPSTKEIRLYEWELADNRNRASKTWILKLSNADHKMTMLIIFDEIKA